MIVAIGIDIVEIDRIEQAIGERGTRFCERVFTSSERAYCDRLASRIASYAARFAAKEAAMKALGTGWSGGVSWREIEVLVEQSGAPTLRFTGRALDRFNKIGARRSHLSLSHSRGTAVAQVVLET